MNEKKYYLLSPAIGLRSWQLVPHAYYVHGVRNAHNLTTEEFSLLVKCNGQEPLEDSPLLQKIEKWGLCVPCAQGATLDEWQKLKLYENRCFSTIEWEITGRCNLNCLHCFNAVDNSPSSDEFTWEECVRFMDDAQASGVNTIIITGGEPMIHPHFMDILRGIHERGMVVDEINTNLCLVTQEMLDEMKSFGCVPEIRTSFDGVGHHDWLRNKKGQEEPTLKAIELCIQNGFQVMVHTNVHKLNKDSIVKTAELLDSMGVYAMRILRTSESLRWLRNSEKLCEGGACLSFEEFYDCMLAFAHDYAAKPHQMRIQIWQFLGIYPQQKRYSYLPVILGEHRYRDSYPLCGSCRQKSGVIANGAISPCIQNYNFYASAGVQFGNVKQVSLKSLYTDSTYLDTVCTSVGQLAAHSEQCRNCPFWKLCMGGCRVFGMAGTKDPLGPDKTKCLYFYKGYMEKTDAAFADSGFLPLDAISRTHSAQALPFADETMYDTVHTWVDTK